MHRHIDDSDFQVRFFDLTDDVMETLRDFHTTRWNSRQHDGPTVRDSAQ